MAAAATAQRRKLVMVSSTARDLPLHREQVRLACERNGFEPRWMMEHLTALNADAVKVSLRMVEEADVYIGILAHRYGTIPTGCELSITEMEYNRAVELDKPRLIFLIHEDHPLRAADVDTGPGADKLKALKARVGEDRVAAFFKSASELYGQVGDALRNLAVETSPAARPAQAIFLGSSPWAGAKPDSSADSRTYALHSPKTLEISFQGKTVPENIKIEIPEEMAGSSQIRIRITRNGGSRG